MPPTWNKFCVIELKYKLVTINIRRTNENKK